MSVQRVGVLCCALLGIFLVTACTPLPVAPRSSAIMACPQPLASIRTRSAPAYSVCSGDTLYAIAFHFGQDYRVLARLNGIAEDYRIYPGQRLRLQPVVAIASSVPTPQKVAQAVQQQEQKAALAERPSVVLVAQSGDAADPGPISGNDEKTSPLVHWQWPSDGNVLQRFAANDLGGKGLDISGKRGDPVASAADGRVVYTGNTLPGYGNLIIVRHDDEFLSAYAHNDRIIVHEGDVVKVGQKIAEIGSSGTSRNVLRFEIRKAGNPVDPMLYLPPRQM